MKVVHPLKPIYDADSVVLLLGTMPSVKSREAAFYYAHPQNRFWKVMAQIYDEKIGKTNEEREAFLHRHHIALFDVLKSCDITASNDQSIKNPVPNDLTDILASSNIKAIYTTGKKSYMLYQKLIQPQTGIDACLLPSTSPANSPKGIEEILYNAYKQIRDYTG